MTEGDDAESDFEARLAKLKKRPGSGKSGTQTPYQQLKQNQAEQKDRSLLGDATRFKDWGTETTHWEGPPHRGDLVANLALGATLLWLPLTFAAIGRGAFVKYRFTDKRVSVVTSAPWKSDQLDAAYTEIASVITVGRGIGLWGDMVLTLKSGDKIELRSVPNHKDLEKYIMERKAELAPEKRPPAVKAASKGFGSP